jgi:hypothetical protein
MWTPSALLSPDGSHLRRVALVSNWSDDRHYSEARSWFSLGEVCAYGLPMQQVVIVLGQSRDGRRHSHWTKGLLHPANKKLRFRKKTNIAAGFKDTWHQVWREDRDEIATKDWISAMIEDDVLRDICFNVSIPVPEKAARQRILDLAARKLDRLSALKVLPDQNLSTCDWPRVCAFRNNCHSGNEPSGRYGFARI